MARALTNQEIADVLERVADLLEAQDANRYRVQAYRRAAVTIREHEQPLVELLAEGGVEAVDALPTIGPTIAAHVAELAHCGALSLLDRLEGEVSPERLFATIPGIGPELARRVYQDLAVETLEDLECAAQDGRLASLAGFGPRRVRAVQQQLATILGRSARHRARRRAWLDARGSAVATPCPDVATLLAVDAEYRDLAARGRLRRIAPRRFNPAHEAWLPVLHTERDGWQITALFSNTSRAHELGRTHDWVVLFYERDGDSGQCTVVTEWRGPHAGRRAVRGRESER
jgi:DNA polymerase (family X)